MLDFSPIAIVYYCLKPILITLPGVQLCLFLTVNGDEFKDDLGFFPFFSSP